MPGDSPFGSGSPSAADRERGRPQRELNSQNAPAGDEPNEGSGGEERACFATSVAATEGADKECGCCHWGRTSTKRRCDRLWACVTNPSPWKWGDSSEHNSR